MPVNHKELAEKVLALLKSGTIHPNDYVSFLYETLDRGNLKPEDIGTTKTEIESFRVPPVH